MILSIGATALVTDSCFRKKTKARDTQCMHAHQYDVLFVDGFMSTGAFLWRF